VFILLSHKTEEIGMSLYLWVAEVAGAGFLPQVVNDMHDPIGCW